MVKVYSDIHNLGDFMHCLPALSGIKKHYGDDLSFVISDRLMRFKGIKELLMYQGIFEEVLFQHEITDRPPGLVIRDDEYDDGCGPESLVSRRVYNNLRRNHGMDFPFDYNFLLRVPELDSDHVDDYMVGDRWSLQDTVEIDERRNSYILKNNGLFEKDNVITLDYSNDLLYNCSLIKYNNKPFITTITGIAVVADLMGKETYVLWDDDLRHWQGFSIEQIFRMHFFKNRDCKLMYVKEFDIEKI